MAKSGQIILNHRAGFSLQWIQTSRDTGGQFVSCLMTLAANAFMPVRHIHPRQGEKFEVVSGQLKVECNGMLHTLSPGESFTVPMGKPHQWWNVMPSAETQIKVTMTPSLNWETQMEQVFGIMNAKGKLSFLQIMTMVRTYDMYIAGPPMFIQNIMSFILSPLARLSGLKNYYPEHSEQIP